MRQWCTFRNIEHNRWPTSCCLLAAWALRKGLDLLALRNRERVAFDMYLKPLILHSVIPGLFLFGINAVPSAESTWSSLQYFLFDSKANCKVRDWWC